MLKKSFTKVAIFMLIVVFVLSACTPSGDTEDKNNESNSTKVEKTTAKTETTSEKIDKEEDKTDSSEKTAKDKDDKTDEDKKNDDKKQNSKTDSSKKSGEDAMQGNDLPDLDYTYESIVNSKTPLVKSPYNKNVTSQEDREKYAQKLVKELKKLEPLTENASDEEIELLFRQMLAIGELDFTPLETMDRFSYVIFQKDGVDPWTNRKVVENMKVNVEIVLDASGSMANKINGEEMMTIAKNSIAEVLAKMPENANVGLRVFGHRGDNTDASMEISCNANELIHPITPLDVDGINNSLTAVKPTGWTSIAQSIENGVNDFKEFNDEKTLNILYIITDGVET